MLQARMSSSDPRLYSPNRDVAHCFPGVVKDLTARMEQSRWAELHKLLDASGHTDHASQAERAKASAVFLAVMAGAVNNRKKGLYDVMIDAGWFELSPALQVMYMAYLGSIMTGVFFAGVRDASFGGPEPAASVEELVAAGTEMLRIQALPRWRRWRFVRKLEGIRNALRNS